MKRRKASIFLSIILTSVRCESELHEYGGSSEGTYVEITASTYIYNGPAKSAPIVENGMEFYIRSLGSGGNTGFGYDLPTTLRHTIQFASCNLLTHVSEISSMSVRGVQSSVRLLRVAFRGVHE